MGKVIVIIKCPSLDSQSLYNSVKDLIPTGEGYKEAMMSLYGFFPTELTVIVEPSEEE